MAKVYNVDIMSITLNLTQRNGCSSMIKMWKNLVWTVRTKNFRGKQRQRKPLTSYSTKDRSDSKKAFLFIIEVIYYIHLISRIYVANKWHEDTVALAIASISSGW